MPNITMRDLTNGALASVDETDVANEFRNLDVEFGYALMQKQNRLNEIISTTENVESETTSLQEQNSFLEKSLKSAQEDILKIIN